MYEGEANPSRPPGERTLEILKEFGGVSEYVFPGRIVTKPLSKMVFLMALRRMEIPIWTPPRTLS